MTDNPKREEAIEFVMKHGYAREAAESIVDREGPDAILTPNKQEPEIKPSPAAAAVQPPPPSGQDQASVETHEAAAPDKRTDVEIHIDRIVELGKH